MEIGSLVETLNKGYYTLPVLEVITDYPLVFLRMLFAEFEKKIFVIKPECKKGIYDNFFSGIGEQRNRFLDTFNRTELGIDPVTSTGKKSYRDHEVELTLNVYGSNLQYTIKGPRGSSANNMTMPISKITTGAFLTKFINLVKEITDITDAQRTWDGTLDTSNKELYKQPSIIGTDINESLKNFFLSIDVYEKEYREQAYVKIRPNFDKLAPGFKHKYDVYRGINFPESFNYDFQFKAFKRCEKYIISYLNRRNFWVNRMSIDDYSIEIHCSPSEDGNRQDKNYQKGYTYIKIQKEALKEFPKALKEYMEKGGRAKREGIETLDDFKRDLIKQVLPPEEKKKKK